MGLAEAGINQVLDLADDATRKALEAVQELEDAAVETGHGLLTVGDKTFDAAFEEVEAARTRLMELVRSLTGKVLEGLPLP